MPDTLTRVQRANLTDLVTELRAHGHAGGWRRQFDIANSHPFMRDMRQIKIFFNLLNDSWRLEPEAIRGILIRFNYDNEINGAFLNQFPAKFDESQFHFRHFAARQWWDSNPWRSERQQAAYAAYRNKFIIRGNSMLLAGELWPHDLIADVIGRPNLTGLATPAYLLYDHDLLRECKKILGNSRTPFMFTTKTTLQTLVDGLPAQRGKLLQERWLPEFLTKRELTTLPEDMAPDFLAALYPDLYWYGAEKYYKRLRARRRNRLVI